MAYLDVSDEFKTVDFKSKDLKKNNFSSEKNLENFQATLKFRFSKNRPLFHGEFRRFRQFQDYRLQDLRPKKK